MSHKQQAQYSSKGLTNLIYNIKEEDLDQAHITITLLC